MRLLAILLLPLALSGCSALSALSDATTVLDVYELQAPDAVPQGGARSLDVIVELPTTTGALDTDRVMVKPSQLQAQYLDDARWGEEMPVMMQSLMLRTLQETEAFRYVAREPLGLSGDVAIVSDVIDFHAVAAPEGEGAEVVLRVRVQLVRETDVAILSSRTFEARAQAPATDTPTLMRAFDSASDALLTEFAGWVLGVL
ncbi:ABC-type transport auxiliary lipoprotein family protein [Roseivivax marinus]|jgi:cholesterol transport system auxiliary component|uniref:ABC-type transport auxiliary lipoprotein family protein n=1 Tax=Roseivivax marinus TaxID=1379903 RepID=UPI001F03B0BE|nr:ABC-type transport auxiliary lipoprotein family protein [Roseivivax marinus]UMA63779.1 ABC-type transport auxiliary lipoprotein family protein [Roseivivax marinus]